MMNAKELSPPVVERDGMVCTEHTVFTKAKLVHFDGHYYAVNPNAILTVNCTSKCNCSCFFCYNHLTFMRDFQYVSMDSPQLRRCLDFASIAGIKRAALSGGEPALNQKRLLDLVGLLSHYKFQEIKLHTNGLLLRGILTYQGISAPLWQHLIRLGLTDLSISLADFHPDRNMKIMGNDTYEAVDAVLKLLRNERIRTRLSCFLCPEGIFTMQQIVAYMHFGNERGVHSFIFRISASNAGENATTIRTLAEEFQSLGWTLAYSHHKPDSTVYELRNGDEKLSFDCANEQKDLDQKIRRLIFMPDNIVYTSWIDPASFLFEEDAMCIVKAAMNPPTQHQAYYSAGTWSHVVPDYIYRNCDHTIDLHVHSMVSDGLLTPVETLKRAAECGIRSLVFTEHNSLHDSPMLLQKVAKRFGIEIPLFGIEFSTVFCLNGSPLMKFHVLVYAEDAQDLDFRSKLFNPNIPRNQHLQLLYQRALKAGVVHRSLDEIYSIHDLEAPTKKKMLTRTPLAREIASNTGLSVDVAKEKWLPAADDALCYQNYIDCETLMELAHRNGCAVVLAHPGWIRSYDKEETLKDNNLYQAIALLARKGLDGIEIVHRLNDTKMRQNLSKLALYFDLIITGGSDFHGKPRCTFGENGAEPEGLDCIKNRIRTLKGSLT